jgi:UDP-N-acetylmuramoyl-tripeptide--D-alanyl-D-alanine ligase
LHQGIGRAASLNDVDVLFTFGPLSKNTHDGAAVAKKIFFEQKSHLIEELLKLVSNGDAVLVKGSRGMKMEEVVAVLAERFPQKGQA